MSSSFPSGTNSQKALAAAVGQGDCDAVVDVLSTHYGDLTAAQVDDIVWQAVRMGACTMVEILRPYSTPELLLWAVVDEMDNTWGGRMDALLGQLQVVGADEFLLAWAARGNNAEAVQRLMSDYGVGLRSYKSLHVAWGEAIAENSVAVVELMRGLIKPQHIHQSLDKAIQAQHTDLALALVPHLTNNHSPSIGYLCGTCIWVGEAAVLDALLQCASTHFIAESSINDFFTKACGLGRTECVRVLLAHFQPHEHYAFQLAVHKQHTAIVQLLLPHVDVRRDNSWALQMASALDNEDIFALLCPHSDPHAALQAMTLQQASAAKMALLRRWVESAAQNAALHQEVGEGMGRHMGRKI